MLNSKYNMKNPYSIALLVILMINALLKWRFFSGLALADDFSYGVYSYSMFRLPLPWDMTMDFRVLRVTLLLPVVLLFRFLPPIEFVAVLYPLLISFGSIILVYLIGRRVYGENAGIFAALSLATFPADIIYSTMLLPDIVVPFYLCLTVWAFLKADSLVGRSAKLWFALTGLFVFFAFTTRENSYYFLLFFLPFAFKRDRWIKGLYLIGVGFAVPLMVLYGFYWLKSGDFMFELNLAGHFRDPLIESGYIPKNSQHWFDMLFLMIPLTGKFVYDGFVYGNSIYEYTFYPGVVFLIYVTVKAIREKKYILLIVPWWYLVVYLYLEFGTISFSSYQMIKKLSRFLLTLTPAMAIMYGVAISDALGLREGELSTVKDYKKWLRSIRRKKNKMVTGPLIIVVMALLFYSSYKRLVDNKVFNDNNLRKFRWGYYDVLEGRENRPIYSTGGWWNNKLSFYFMPDLRFADMQWRKSEMLNDLKAVAEPSDLAGSYVIIDHSHFSGKNDLGIRHSYDEFGDYVKMPPKEWELLGYKHGVEIYEVPANWTYHVPDGKELVHNTLLHSLEIDRYMLFLNCLHPDLTTRITETNLKGLFNKIVNKNDPLRKDILDNRLIYKEFKNTMKIDFFKVD
ncbi:ArnT family glycosyltransferase [Candidatus Latescibacterota bacterium]